VIARRFRAMGTDVELLVEAEDAKRALEAAEDEFHRLEALLSRFRPDSELSRLNAERTIEPAPDLLEVVELALLARGRTGGRFDPTVHDALVAAGYDRSFEQVAERPARRVERWRAGAAIELDETAGCARLEDGAAVDLGGIGKGYAAARALAAMREAWPMLPGGLVDLGGDLALGGSTPEGGSWRIAVADPRRPGTSIGVLLVQSGGVATSGRDVRRFGPGGSLHHLIDPETGEPAEPGPLAVTVTAPDAAEAEAHATALGISAAIDAETHVAANPRISAVFVPQEGEPLLLGRPPLARSRLLVRAA
jgi:FAD:protein FMN transferase